MKQLPVACTYDCALSKPLRSRRVLRLEAVVKEVLGARPLTSPLTQQECVIYSTTVSKRARGQGLALSFAAANVDFKLSMVDDPSTEVEVMGMDVSLFDMCQGRLVRMEALEMAPPHWRAFVVNNQVEGGADGKLSIPELSTEDASVDLEFQESALLIGSTITVVGELCRTPSGTLMLQPLEPMRGGSPVLADCVPACEDAGAGARVEQAGQQLQEIADWSKNQGLIGMSDGLTRAVVASDDPNLLNSIGESTSDTSDSDVYDSDMSPSPAARAGVVKG